LEAGRAPSDDEGNVLDRLEGRSFVGGCVDDEEAALTGPFAWFLLEVDEDEWVRRCFLGWLLPDDALAGLSPPPPAVLEDEARVDEESLTVLK